MLIVISPAKTLDYETPATTASHTLPDYLEESAELITQLRSLSPPEVSSLMGISAKLGDLNFGRFLNWQQDFTPNNAKQSLLAFKGDVYTGLGAESLSEDQLQWAQNHLRILSGLYGLLRPLDLMQPYRLEMGTKFANSRGVNLYEFWGDKITDGLNRAIKDQASKKQNADLLINLASNEYFKSVKPGKLNADVITPVFKDWKNDKYKIISFYAKKARGLMSRYIIENQIEDPEKIKQFDVAGYAYQPAMSSAREWVFTREGAE
ncbi:MAG: peroxide stress protein YaaA [Porticoccus sp.]|nr:peroxide stress protein YaaA [Porticoccus sp.]